MLAKQGRLGLPAVQGRRPPADSGFVERLDRLVALPPMQLLVAFVGVAVGLVIVLGAVVSVNPSATAGQNRHDPPLNLATGPFTTSAVPPSFIPALAPAGPNAAAIWVRDPKLLPAAPVSLFGSAGVPAVLVHRAADAFTHPLVLVWPTTDLRGSDWRQLAAYGHAGGTVIAVAPDPRTRSLLRHIRGVSMASLVTVPETGLGDGTRRDAQILSLRRFWQATPGGFRLGDAPDGQARALVLIHDLRSPAAYAGAPAFAREEHSRGISATYVAQTKYIADQDGPALVSAAARDALEAVRADGGDVAAGGVTGSIAHMPTGDGTESYPAYSPAYATSTTLVGASTFGELRVSGQLVHDLAGVTPVAFRAAGGSTPRGFAGAAQGAGYQVDATLAATRAGGAFPFFQSLANGAMRPVLRIPVSFQDLPGERLDERVGALTATVASHRVSDAPTAVAITPDVTWTKLYAEQAMLASAGPDVWVGSLDSLAGFWQGRAGLALDARPASGSGFSSAWFVRITAPSGQTVSNQTLVAPFRVRQATGPDGHTLTVRGGTRIALPPVHGSFALQVMPAA
jgi:hypothetical protein